MKLIIDEQLPDILSVVFENRITIITSPTGTGKSIGIPKELIRQGFSVVTTQSRILAARSLAEFQSFIHESEVGTLFGYNTGYGSNYTQQTQGLYRTDGTELLFRFNQQSHFDFLIIDEVHEWNHNQELLIAKIKQFLTQQPQLRIIVMSATMHAYNLSTFLDDAPVLELEGHPHDIVERTPQTDSIAQEAALHAQQNKNVLCFLPGKAEIARTIEEIYKSGFNGVVLPLHSEQSATDQARVFEEYDKPKIICATDIAQTTITIADLDEVLTCGIKRGVRVVDGVMGLYYERLSQFEETQQRGRIGRVKVGGFTNMYNGSQEQALEPAPTIQRTPIDQQALRLATIGEHINDVSYYHKPPHDLVDQAYELLYELDALDKSGSITHIGEMMAQLSCKSEFARMIVEAQNLSVLPDVVKIVACLEVNGINDGKNARWKKGINNTSSDLIGQLELFNKARTITSENRLKKCGIHVQKWTKAVELHEKLWRQLHIMYPKLQKENKSCNKAHVILACLTGLKSSVYKSANGKIFGDPVVRKIGRHSNATPRYSGWVAGIPFDLEIQTEQGTKMLHLLTFVTHVTQHQLAKVQAHKHTRIKSYRYLKEQGLILVSKGLDETVMTWEGIMATHSPKECEVIRKQLIAQQFEEATEKFHGPLKRHCMGKDFSLVGKTMDPADYGKDPASGDILYAFPAFVLNPKTNKVYLQHFKTQHLRDKALQIAV